MCAIKVGANFALGLRAKKACWELGVDRFSERDIAGKSASVSCLTNAESAVVLIGWSSSVSGGYVSCLGKHNASGLRDPAVEYLAWLKNRHKTRHRRATPIAARRVPVAASDFFDTLAAVFIAAG